MTQPHSPAASVSSPLLPLLVLLFVGSGCAALIYEIVWFQMLQLVIGSSALSLSVLLATFMGGMCIGSLLLPRVIGTRWHPLKVYGALEAGIAVMGVLVLVGMPLVERVNLAWVGHGSGSVLLRALVCGMCLLTPTVLMGATLPAIARYVEATPRGVSWLGFFYGGNIAGAVFGCLLAGFYLLRQHDLLTATAVAVTINLAVGAAAVLLARVAAHAPGRAAPGAAGSLVPQRTEEAAGGSWAILLVIGLSGMSALGAEVIWTRILSLMLGATVYTFSIILAVFLTGLGIGSSIGAVVARTTPRPRAALGVCQLLLAACIAWSAYALARSLPYWPVEPPYSGAGARMLAEAPWIQFHLDLARCVWALFPPTLLWGASFPLALAAVPARGRDTGKLVGGVYAANTVGAIAGAIALTAFVALDKWGGTQNAQRLLIVLAVTAALIALVPTLWTARTIAAARPYKPPAPGVRLPEYAIPGRTMRWGPAAAMACGVAAAGWLCAAVPAVPWHLIAYGRSMLSNLEWYSELVYLGEGMNASVAVTQGSDGSRSFHVSGKVEASTIPQDMRLQRMLGHMSALMHEEPRTVLVVGCGAGVTAGCFVKYPGIERIVICEIEPLIPKVVARYFSEENHDVLSDPRVQVVYDDARHYIRTTKEKFDIITSDPIHPWVKGAATLYTQEYFQMCRERLNPGGLMTQWVPLYESNSDVVKSELATFFRVFPQGTIWSNDINGAGYDVVLVGQAQPRPIDVDEIQRRLDRPDHAGAAASLAGASFHSAVDLLRTYAGRATDLAPWLADAQINRDRNLRLQYLAGLGMLHHMEDEIYQQILGYRVFPEDLFLASEQSRAALRLAMFNRRWEQQ